MTTLNNWHANAIDFDQSCTHADYDPRVYLCLPAVFYVKNKDRNVVKLIKNLHSLRQEGWNFYEKLKSELEKRGFI